MVNEYEGNLSPLHLNKLLNSIEGFLHSKLTALSWMFSKVQVKKTFIESLLSKVKNPTQTKKTQVCV